MAGHELLKHLLPGECPKDSDLVACQQRVPILGTRLCPCSPRFPTETPPCQSPVLLSCQGCCPQPLQGTLDRQLNLRARAQGLSLARAL